MTTAPSDRAAARLADAQAQLAAVRAPTAPGPGADRDALRAAYLGLLKLALCDLTSASTISVGAAEDRSVLAREIRGDELRLRAAGMDWPLQGLTMVGLARLDDLQECVEAVVRDGVEGDVIEAGAWRGGASLLMRATLDALGDDRTVVVADSFQGFPAEQTPDPAGIDLSAFDFLAVPLEEVRESFARLGCERGVEFVPGFFEETLPRLWGRRWAIARLDADTYEATLHALRCLYPGVAVGGYLVLDDYGQFEGCRQAVDEFRSEHGITELLEKVDHTSVRWRRERESPELPAPAPAPVRPRAITRPREVSVPTVRELALAAELRECRAALAAADERAAAAEAQIGLRAWIRRRIKRVG
jgi:O-methyltransferase